MKVCNFPLLQTSFLPGALALQQTITNFSSLPASPGPVALSVTGTGQVSVSLALNFVPLNVLTFPTYRGIWMESVLQMVSLPPGMNTSGSSSGADGSSHLGGSLNEVPLGSVVQLTVQVIGRSLIDMISLLWTILLRQFCDL